ncbi:hypothetical protein CASFOL_023310 [Castilleja foliolosa]|uniref:Uncharacterized protein n=1 Tax=Castilleja foliolosa TaxID=1961234 RepID=A0ABD3CN35_9LAMI
MLITNTMEKTYFGSKRHNEPDEFDLKEWTLKAKIGRENTNSRRFSASNLKSFRENEKCFRSNITISSTVSSPGYTIRDEINPSTYSFTTALKALQAKTVYTWEYISPNEGLTLNSKWNEAEKYICNPLSGQVPLECLSSKTLSRRSFRNRITIHHPSQPKSPIIDKNGVKITIQDIKRSTTKGITPVDLSSSSPSPAPTTSIEERSIQKRDEDSSFSTEKLVSEAKKYICDMQQQQGQVKEKKQSTKRKKVIMKMMMCINWRHKSRNNYENNNNNHTSPTFVCHVNASFRK